MTISYSDFAKEIRERLLEDYPGISNHFSKLEKAILAEPLSGTLEIMPNRKGGSLPVHTMGTSTDIFGGAASYSKELIAVYVYSENLQEIRVIQILF